MRMLLKENARLNTNNADKTRRLQKEYKDLHDRSRELKDGYHILLEDKEYNKNMTAMISARVNSIYEGACIIPVSGESGTS